MSYVHKETNELFPRADMTWWQRVGLVPIRDVNTLLLPRHLGEDPKTRQIASEYAQETITPAYRHGNIALAGTPFAFAYAIRSSKPTLAMAIVHWGAFITCSAFARRELWSFRARSIAARLNDRHTADDALEFSMNLLAAAQFCEKHMSLGAKVNQAFFPSMSDPVFVRETATHMARLSKE